MKVAGNKREGFGTRMGFILVSAGCAIGIGNVWKFPYITGQNGGAVFVLFYLAFLLLIGIPVLTMELAIGRASRKSMLQGYKILEKEGTKWHIHGWLGIAANYLLMMYYTVVSGWMLAYFYKFVTGKFDNTEPGRVSEVFNSMLANPVEMTIFTGITVILGFAVVFLGVKKGLERINTFMMAMLLILIILLTVRCLMLQGAGEGVMFYLYPDWERTRTIGITNVMAAAMSQAFFTLSIGVGSIEIFGSYMSGEHTILGESIRIAVLDTFVALMAGMVIFPACFSYGVRPDQGPSLIFITLPTIFLNMHMSRLWGSLFFIFMTFASFSTVTAVFENIVANGCDNLGWSRNRSVFFNLIFMLIASLPCIFGYNIWSGLRFLGGRNVLDTEDFLVSNIMLPLGSLVIVLFCTIKAGWGYKNYLGEVNTGKGIKISEKAIPYLSIVLPILILMIFISELV